MRVAFHNNGNKGDLVAAALRDAGHTIRENGTGDIAVCDHDANTGLCDRHERVVLYPHGGNPLFDWDEANDVHPHVRAHLTHGPGNVEVMEAYGYPAPLTAVGWCYSEVAPPRYPSDIRRILFAPSHPSGAGYLNPTIASINQRACSALVATGAEVHLRLFMGHDAAGHGITDTTGITATTNWKLLAHDDIDAADLVVSDGTLAHLALARGVPVLWITSDIFDLGNTGYGECWPAHWAELAPMVRYPYDMDDDNLDDLLTAVCAPSMAVEEYRRRFIGGPFDAGRVVSVCEEVAAGAYVG